MAIHDRCWELLGCLVLALVWELFASLWVSKKTRRAVVGAENVDGRSPGMADIDIGVLGASDVYSVLADVAGVEAVADPGNVLDIAHGVAVGLDCDTESDIEPDIALDDGPVVGLAAESQVAAARNSQSIAPAADRRESHLSHQSSDISNVVLVEAELQPWDVLVRELVVVDCNRLGLHLVVGMGIEALGRNAIVVGSSLCRPSIMRYGLRRLDVLSSVKAPHH